MIRGIVRPRADDGTGLEAWVDITVAGSERSFQTLPAVVDTGATNWLTLSESVVQELGLRNTGNRRVYQAHGGPIQVKVYVVWVLWHGRMRRVFAEAGNETLIGTDLLAGNRLAIDWWEGGDVIIEEPTAPAQ